MTNKIQRLPCLPGYNFDTNLARKRFNRTSEFDKLHDGVFYLADKSKKSPHDRYPASYAWGERPSKPTWLELDGQRLMFNAYFRERLHEGRATFRIRHVKISFFLEDGTIKVSERPTLNSGLEQGVLVRRQRIPLPDPIKYRYYDILDLNVGKEPNIYGHVYKIYNCDEFTRHFLNRMGIHVPEPIELPIDAANDKLKNTIFGCAEPRRKKKEYGLDNFLKYDGMVLRFFGQWDDSDMPYGYVHNLELLYYLVDDTIEVRENMPVKAGPPEKKLLVKRSKVPKFFTEIDQIGSNHPLTLLNVIGDNAERSYYVADRSYRNYDSTQKNRQIRDYDLTIGAELNVYGRKIVLTNMDEFTKKYYRAKYGLDDFTPINDKKGIDKDDDRLVYGRTQPTPPPYNGFGSYDDSLMNCYSVLPKPPKTFTDRAFVYENQTNDNRALRFGAKMISDVPANDDRCFVVCVRLFDKTVAIYELGCQATGRTSTFLKAQRIRIPGQKLFTSDEPKYYEPRDFYVGARLVLDGFKFQLVSADDYTLDHMERHCNEFSKSDIGAIMAKIRDRLRSTYPEFVTDFSPVDGDDRPAVLSQRCLREALNKYAGEGVITDHEILALARHYSLCERGEICPRESLRSLVHTELNRNVWQELDRLEEDIRDRDRDKNGYLERNEIYKILRASRIPLELELLNLMLERLRKNEQGQIDCLDLIDFLNVKIDPVPPAVPTNFKHLYRTITLDKPIKDCGKVDWCAFLDDLGLMENQLSNGEQ